MRSGRTLPILALFMLLGCSGPVTFTRLTDTVYPAGSKEGIELFVGKEPTREYIRIALLSTNLRKESFAANIDLMKRQAAELGADALILIAQKSTLGSLLLAEMEIASQLRAFEGEAGYKFGIRHKIRPAKVRSTRPR